MKKSAIIRLGFCLCMLLGARRAMTGEETWEGKCYAEARFINSSKRESGSGRITGKQVVNRKVLGNISIYYADDGSGVWDPVRRKPVDEAVRFAKEAGITVFRYPGGCAGHNYEWKKMIGPFPRPPLTYPEAPGLENAYGIDEFVEFCRACGAEPLITLSYFMNTPETAGELVEYCNGSVNTRWGRKRAAYGHPKPYGIKYWEIDNEVEHGNHITRHSVNMIEEYLPTANRFQHAMKKVDPRIKVSYCWCGPVTERLGRMYREGGVDCLSKGGYYHHQSRPKNEKGEQEANGIFEEGMGFATAQEANLRALLDRLDYYTKKRVGLFVYEHNIGFPQEPEIQFSLFGALCVADCLQKYVRMGDRIELACYHLFMDLTPNGDEWFGQIKGMSPDPCHRYRRPKSKLGPYVKRPAQYAFEMCKRFLGEYLVDTKVCGDGFRLSSPAWTLENDSNLYLRGIDVPAKADRVRLQVKWEKGDSPGEECMLSSFKLYDPNDPEEKTVLPDEFILRIVGTGDTRPASVSGSPGSPTNVLRIEPFLGRGEASAEFRVKPGRYSFEYQAMCKKEARTAEETLNVLEGGSFSSVDDFRRWWSNPLDGLQYSYDEREGFRGKGSFRVDIDIPKDENIFHVLRPLKVAPGGTYGVTAYFKANLVGETPSFGIEVQDSRGYGFLSVRDVVDRGDYDWTRLRLEFTAREDQDTYHILIARHYGYGNRFPLKGRLWIDDVAVREIARPPAKAEIVLDSVDKEGNSLSRERMRVEKLTPFFRKYESKRVPHISALASLNEKRDRLYLLVLNRDLSKEREVSILSDAKVRAEATPNSVYIRGLEGKTLKPSWRAAVLTGPSIAANNETNPDTIRIVAASFDAPAGRAFRYAFKPFSLTGIEFGIGQ